MCEPRGGYPDPSELEQPPPSEFADLLTAWLGGMENSSRPVRRYCLASLMPNSIGTVCHHGALMQLSRLVIRSLHTHRPSAIASRTYEEEPSDSSPFSSIRHILSRLINSLLTSLSRDSDPDIRLLYAKWLGALGAIDPSRSFFSSIFHDYVHLRHFYKTYMVFIVLATLNFMSNVTVVNDLAMSNFLFEKSVTTLTTVL